MSNQRLHIDAWKFEVTASGDDSQKVVKSFWEGVDLCDTMRGGGIKKNLRRDIIQILQNIADKAAK